MSERYDYAALTAGYAAALAGWWWLRSRLPGLWPSRPRPTFPRPWREVGWVLLGVVGVIAVGQLWSRRLLFAETGPAGSLGAVLNQMLIFLPVMAVPWIRGHARDTCWIPGDRLPIRFGLGTGLALGALIAWSAVHRDDHGLVRSIAALASTENLDEVAQVLFEDVAAATLFVRLAAALGERTALFGVAGLFAAAHLPALLAGGDGAEAWYLLGDAALALAALLTLRRAADIVWFWPVHAVMDLTQFSRITG